MNLKRLFVTRLGPVNSLGFLSNPDGTDRVRRLATKLDCIHRFNNPEETIVLRTECPLGVLSTENAAKWLVGSLHAKLVIKCSPELFDVRDVDAALRLLQPSTPTSRTSSSSLTRKCPDVCRTSLEDKRFPSTAFRRLLSNTVKDISSTATRGTCVAI